MLPPLWVGGRGEAALQRAGRLCDGYINYVVISDQFARTLKAIAGHYAEAKRSLA